MTVARPLLTNASAMLLREEEDRGNEEERLMKLAAEEDERTPAEFQSRFAPQQRK